MLLVAENLRELYRAYREGRRAPVWLDLIPYLFAATAILSLLLFASKMWATNDDAGMAMAVEGYGIASAPSPGIVYSSVAWGWLLTLLPHLSFIEPYAAMTYLLLALSALALALALWRLRAPSLLVAAALLAMYTRAIFHPQFTIVAGYLAVAGLMVLYAWRNAVSRRHLYAAAFLLLVAGLIRTEELILVLGVCLPFLAVIVWRNADNRQRRRWLLLSITVLVLLAASKTLDHYYYSSEGWRSFMAMNDVRLPFTDYKFGAYVISHPETLSGSELTRNDISLITRWFYPDDRVFNRGNFAPLLASASLTGRMAANLPYWRQPLEVLQDPQLLPLLYLCLLPFLLGRGWKFATLASLLLLGTSLMALFLLGRGGIARVYVPAAAVVLMFGLATAAPGRRLPLQVAGLVAVILLTSTLLQDWRLSFFEGQNRRAHGSLIAEFCKLPQHDLLLIWGGGYFQYPALYDQTQGPAAGCGVHLYPISTMSLTPYSTANLYNATDERNPIDALLHGHTLYIYTELDDLGMLSTYLQEHYGSSLSYSVVATALKSLNIYALRATPATHMPATIMRP